MTTIPTAQTLGDALRTARKRPGLTQADLALAAGLGVRFIVELEAASPRCAWNRCCVSLMHWADHWH